MIVFSMCCLVYNDVVEDKNKQVIKDLRQIVGEPSTSKWLPKSPQEISNRLFHSAYSKYLPGSLVTNPEKL